MTLQTIADDVPLNTPISIGFDNRENAPVPASRLFGVLLLLTRPLVEHFHSDLYHDATWLRENVEQGEVRAFFYGADDYGTAIGTDLEYVSSSRRTVWRVEVLRVGSQWGVQLEPIEN